MFLYIGYALSNIAWMNEWELYFSVGFYSYYSFVNEKIFSNYTKLKFKYILWDRLPFLDFCYLCLFTSERTLLSSTKGGPAGSVS